MKQRYRLFSGIVLAVIAICWIIFLISREPDKEESGSKDMMRIILNNTKEAIAAKAEPTVTVTPEPTPELTVTPEPTGEPVTPAPTPIVLPDYTKFDYIIANVNEKMNVRSGAGQNKKVVGSLLHRWQY